MAAIIVPVVVLTADKKETEDTFERVDLIKTFGGKYSRQYLIWEPTTMPAFKSEARYSELSEEYQKKLLGVDELPAPEDIIFHDERVIKNARYFDDYKAWENIYKGLDQDVLSAQSGATLGIKIESVSEMPEGTKVVYCPGYNSVQKGEILVDKWLYNYLMGMQIYKDYTNRITVPKADIERILDSDSDMLKFVFFGNDVSRPSATFIIFFAALKEYGILNYDMKAIESYYVSKKSYWDRPPLSVSEKGIKTRIVGYYETDTTGAFMKDEVSMSVNLLYGRDWQEQIKDTYTYEMLQDNYKHICYTAE